jgi:hypothetical protein
MALSLSALEEAFARIEDVITETYEFEVGDIKVLVRTLLPDEETEIQQYGQSAYEEVEEDDENALPANMQYLNRIKIGTLSYALVKIGDLDFQNVDVVETGEMLEGGKPVVIPKHEAVREILLKHWGLPTILAVFKKFAEFVGKREERSEKLVEFEPSDVDTEIQRLKERIEELEKQKADAEKKITSPTAEQVREAEEQIEAATEEPLEFEPGSSLYEEEPEDAEIVPNPEQMLSHLPPEKRPATERPSAIPPQAPPPPARPKGEAAPQAPQSEGAQPEEAPETYADPLADIQTSFVDFTDSDKLQNELAAEERRLLEARVKAKRDAAQQAAAGQRTQPPSAEILGGEAIPTSRIPPHVAAQKVARG